MSPQQCHLLSTDLLNALQSVSALSCDHRLLLKCEKHDSPPHGREVGCVLATQPYGPAKQWHCLCSSKDAALLGELASDQAINSGVYGCLCWSVLSAWQEWIYTQGRELWPVIPSARVGECSLGPSGGRRQSSDGSTHLKHRCLCGEPASVCTHCSAPFCIASCLNASFTTNHTVRTIYEQYSSRWP